MKSAATGPLPVFPILFCLVPVTDVSAQPDLQGWVFGLGSGAATVSFEGDRGDGAALVDLRIGYGLNGIVTPYLNGAYADIRSPRLEGFDRMTFSHVDLGVRLHVAAGSRRWVPYGDLALTFWRVSDVLKSGERTTTDFMSMPTFSVGGGLAIFVSESWALDVSFKAAEGTFRNVILANTPAGGTSGRSGTVLHLDAASVRLGVGLSWWP